MTNIRNLKLRTNENRKEPHKHKCHVCNKFWACTYWLVGDGCWNKATATHPGNSKCFNVHWNKECSGWTSDTEHI